MPSALANSFASRAFATQPVRTSSGMSGGVTTCSGKRPTLDVTTGRPMACACATTRPSTGGSIAGITTVSAAASAGRHVAAVAGEPYQGLHPLGLRLIGDGARIFGKAAMLAGEHENEAAHLSVEQRARNLGKNELAVEGSDPSGHEQDASVLRDPPGLAQRLDPFGNDGSRMECDGVDAAGNDCDTLAREAITDADRRSGVIRRRDHPVAARERAGPVGA